mmetsp:Transcript_29434/g.71619  ORF Transcript_29434/g.71619 Transcript_29434/m.71619 type:complete len:300 (-) Transcript_29434:586-1485(-)
MPSAHTATALALAAGALLLGVVLLRRQRSAARCARYWRGKHVCVTGGSSGIGAALAEAAAGYGASVSICGRRAAALAAVKRRVEQRGGRAEAFVLDVRRGGEPRRVLADAEGLLGPVDVLVVNAGVNHEGQPFTALSEERVDAVLETNLRGALACIGAVLPGMLRRRGGQVVAVSSLAAYRGLAGGSVYGATKAALTVFMESLRIELYGSGVRCTTVHPGFVATPAIEKLDHPKPFQVSAVEAAEYILRAAAAGATHYGFPWVMEHVVMRFAVAVPTSLYDFIMSRSVPEAYTAAGAPR